MTSSRLAQFASDSAPPAHAVPGTTVKEDARRITVRLPANRPFANIIEVKHTTAAPPHLQRIIDQKGTNPTEKSARLKAALRRDNQMLLVYCLLLSGTQLAVHSSFYQRAK